MTVALPGSIVDNAQTHELRSYLVGQVARACAIFNVDEIVVFATESGPPAGGRRGVREGRERDGGGERAPHSDGCVFMARLLQYIECPQYLCLSVYGSLRLRRGQPAHSPAEGAHYRHTFWLRRASKAVGLPDAA